MGEGPEPQEIFVGRTEGASGEGGTTTAVGWEAARAVPVEVTSTSAVGLAALRSLTAGNKNTATGAFSLLSLTEGEANTGVGAESLRSVTVGSRNTACGEAALGNGATPEENTAVGWQAGLSATGTGSIFIGAHAGQEEAGSNKLYIANNKTIPIIQGVMSETAASQQIGFLGAAPTTKKEVTGITVTPKELAEILEEYGLVKVN